MRIAERTCMCRGSVQVHYTIVEQTIEAGQFYFNNKTHFDTKSIYDYVRSGDMFQ